MTAIVLYTHMQVQELMAGQVANALFGWVDAPMNDIFDDARSIIDDADEEDEQKLEKKYLREAGEICLLLSQQLSALTWLDLAVCLLKGNGCSFEAMT